MANQFKADVTMLTTADSGWRDPAKCQIGVVHTFECPRGDDVERRAGWQQDTMSGSYNMLIGTKRTLRANDDNFSPWAAGTTGNVRGLHLSFLAYASDSRATWLKYNTQLELGAAVMADWCTRYGIPPVKLTADQVRAGKRGICGHGEVSAAWREVDHTDPGAGFPWDIFIDKVKRHMNGGADRGETVDKNAADNRVQLRGPGDGGWNVDALIEAARKRDPNLNKGTLVELVCVLIGEVRAMRAELGKAS